MQNSTSNFNCTRVSEAEYRTGPTGVCEQLQRLGPWATKEAYCTADARDEGDPESPKRAPITLLRLGSILLSRRRTLYDFNTTDI